MGKGTRNLNSRRNSTIYSSVPEGHEITISRSRGDMTLTSYGEGWKNGYHVEHTDRYGGEFIDAGTVGNYTIGDKVLWKYNSSDIGEPKEVEITFAHRYPNGTMEYTVRDSSGDGHSASPKTLDTYNRRRATASEQGVQAAITTVNRNERRIRQNERAARTYSRRRKR